MFSSLPGLCPLEASSNTSSPSRDNQKCLQTLSTVLWGTDCPLVGTTAPQDLGILAKSLLESWEGAPMEGPRRWV